jgi:hypothetical protein
MVQMIAAAVCLVLVERGWTLSSSPGEAITLRHDGRELKPFPEIRGIVLGKVSMSDWQQRCTDAGISGLPLTATRQRLTA